MAKMTPKKKQNLRRIRRFIKSAEKRGYQFKQELKESLSKLSTQKLKALTPEKLYKQAEYKLDEDTTISGERGRKLERTISAKKALRTRMVNKYGYEEYLRRYEPSSYEAYKQDYDSIDAYRWEEEQKKIENISVSDYQEEYIPSFTDIVLSNIEQMIEDAKSAKWEQYKTNGYTVEGYLKEEIATYGRDKVAIACEEAPDETKAQAQLALMSSTSEECKQRSVAMVMIITSHIPTIDESKQFTEQA